MQNEVKLLLELLPKYYAHVERYPHTLLIKFYGLYRVVPNNGSKVCSMSNHSIASLDKCCEEQSLAFLHVSSGCSTCTFIVPGMIVVGLALPIT